MKEIPKWLASDQEIYKSANKRKFIRVYLRTKNLSNLYWEGLGPGIDRLVTQLILDTHQLVVLGHPI
jgi:hypothetical protein